MGRQAYLIGEDETAISWMEESLRRYHQEADDDKTVRLEDILKYYAFSSFNQGVIIRLRNGNAAFYNLFKLFCVQDERI